MRSEKVIINLLKKKFPSYGILSEEKYRKIENQKFIWVIDPLDGTVNFSRGLLPFGVSIALVKEKNVILGVVYDPMNRLLFQATLNKGAFLNNKKIKVSNINQLNHSIIYITELPRTQKIIKPLIDKVGRIRILTSTVCDICNVACGKIEAFIKVARSPYDLGAASLIVEEAGGRVTNFDGSRWDIDSRRLIISNGRIHNKILKLIQ